MTRAPVTKALIPAAGFGTRMLPAAKAIPKEMLPVLDRPTIQYVVEESVSAGANDVLIVSSREKKSLEDHFDRFPELEARLKSGGKEHFVSGLNRLIESTRLTTTRQREQLGLGHAVLQGKTHIGDQPFLCLLGDTIFSGSDISPAQELVNAYQKFGTAIIGLQQVPPDKVEKYGIVAGNEVDNGVLKLTDLVEKPSRDSAPSNFAIAARYLLTPTVFACLEKVRPGKGGEIQLTDALKELVHSEPIHGIVLQSTRHDIGDPTEWLRTNLIFARRDAKMWSALKSTIDSIA